MRLRRLVLVAALVVAGLVAGGWWLQATPAAAMTPELQTAATCRYGIVPPGAAFPVNGGAGRFDVITSAGCPWTASTAASWIHITTTSGTGPGTVFFTVDPVVGVPEGVPPRLGAINVAGQDFLVFQAGIPGIGCRYDLFPTGGTYSAQGGPGAFAVLTSAAGCRWTAKTEASWIHLAVSAGPVPTDAALAPSAGLPPGFFGGFVRFMVDPNPSTSGRAGAIAVEDKIYTVLQRGAGEYFVTTDPATSVTETEAVLNGHVTLNGQAASVWFEWGTMGKRASTPEQPISATTGIVPFSAPLSNLAPGTTYVFRAVARIGGVLLFGNPLAFTTEGPAIGSRAVRMLPRCYVPRFPVPVGIMVVPATGVQSYAVQDRPPAGWTVSLISPGGQWDAATGLVKWGPFNDATPRTLYYRVTPPADAIALGTFAGQATFDAVTVTIAGHAGLPRCLPHPADVNEDFCLTVEEATWFGRLWRQGEAGTATLFPAPTSDLVTRVGFLWRSGECYVVEPTASCPLCWVPRPDTVR